MRWPSIVITTGLVIVVSGLNVRDVESKSPDVSEGVGVIDDIGEDVEDISELGELLSVVVVGVDVVDGGSEVEGGTVEDSSRVDGSLAGEERVSLSVKISGRI